MVIRAVIFDMGGVLQRGQLSERLTQAWASVGLNEDLFSAIGRANPIVQQSLVGKASREEGYVALTKELSERFPIPESFWALRRSERKTYWDEGLLDFAQRLRPRVKTAVLSDAWLDTREQVKEHVNDSVFDVIVISAEAGVAKPDPAIYRLTLERLGVAPEEAIFVDDWPANVEGARALGIHAILFQDTEQVKAEIEKLLAS